MNFRSISNRMSIVFLLGLAVHQNATSEVLFQEDFDDQPDWTSAMHSTDRAQYAETHTIPEGWFAVRQDPTWAPSTGHPDRHESIEILSSNAQKARGGTGKSSVHYRDYYETPNSTYWTSDSILAKYFPEGYDELYVEFYVRFQDGWTPEGAAKIFRVGSWSGNPDFFGYGGGRQNGPMFFLDYYKSSGIRNQLAFRSGPHGVNYGMNSNRMQDVPRSFVGSGDLPLNFNSNTVGSTYGDDPTIPDKLNGGYISKNINDYPEHEQIYGPAGTWTKYGFYFKMNSSPGSMDGEFKQWIDDQLILETKKVTWVDTNPENKMVKWNVVALGGNNDWETGTYSNSERHQEWYAIDDVMIATEPPEYLLNGSGLTAPPAPPGDIEIQ